MLATSEVISTTGTLSIMSQLSNGIYLFTSKVGSRAAADEYLSQIEALFRDNTNGPLLRILIDSTVAAVPLNYVIPRYKDLEKRYPKHSPVRMAIMADNSLIALMSGIANALRLQQTSRFFNAGQFAEATAWLLANK